MKPNYNYFKKKNKLSKGKKVLFGDKGKEYSKVSLEIEQSFRDWLAFANLTDVEFDQRMSKSPYKIEESINGDGDIEVNVFAGGEKVIAPLVYQTNSSDNVVGLDNFLVDALLLLSYVASRTENKEFEQEVKSFADRMIAERKMTLG